ncbi:unnamed protein product [[Actinomadura] parvosata subsp. kistnae]|uniref:Uncharacterized protein n=1 Tax=[Actinomadura] parvosata subsp. kistnae TaxID=1909395 RepID=A0A1V0A6B0_9ACTN|nr:DUF6297 family protein [Nonomuraea sp. ATCC 55076]AQZ65692.1 hypothetical protein BKM31_33320 [Nonomuraea sp. ATCC 55076]SPL97090.1 unnamed protein product [Actinomadura parvosata subsp. kistnae]
MTGGDGVTGASGGDVRTLRAYVRSRTRTPASLMDRYVSVFCLLMLIAVAGRPVSGVLASLAVPGEPARMGAGVALLALALAGFLAAARGAGPVLLPGADASWLLLSPLNRRHVLARSARLLLGVAAVAGLLLGIGLLAVLGAPDQLVWRVLGALVVGVAAAVGGMALAVLGQASESWRVWLTGGMALLLALAVVAVTGQLRAVLAVAASAPLPTLTAAVSGAAVLSGLLVRQAWATLDRIPTRTLVTSSTRAGHVASAAMSLDPGALTWIAEDNHWRARKLASRRWPSLPAPLSLPAPFALAWQDWRRLARRRGRLAAVAGSAALPAVLAQAGGPPVVLGLAVLGGALAVASLGTSGARRDADNPALARLIGVGRRQALAARAALPALLAGTWAAVALAGLTLVSGVGAGAGVGVWANGAPIDLMVSGGAAWWWFGPLAAPALAAGALRMARRPPVDHSMPVIDTPGGAVPTGPLFWAATGPDLALLGCLPTAAALASQPTALAPFLVAQAVLSVLVLLGFLMRAE